MQKAGPRKVILFSHHQPFSRLDKQGPNLQTALADLFQKKAITAWYWGHEHDCIIYDRTREFGLLGRCIGHGGIPAPRKSKVMNAPTTSASTASPGSGSRRTPTRPSASCSTDRIRS